MSSLRAIAKASGVSVATVSYVLNNRASEVSPDTRARVMKVMRELNYKPGAIPASQTASTSTLGVVYKNVSGPLRKNPYYGGILDGIMAATAEVRWNTLLYTALDWEADVHRSLRLYCDGRCDGLVLMAPPSNSPLTAGLLERGIPFVLINTESDNPNVSTVDIDNVEATRAIVRHLTALGHKRIAAFPGDQAFQNVSERLRGFRLGLEEAGIDYDEGLVIPGIYWPSSGHERALQILSWPVSRRPTAIVCDNDSIASGALSALLENGVRVPEEISIVGFDDLPYVATLNPPLTTMRQPLEEMGERAARLLLQHIFDNDASVFKEILPFELVIRGSTGPAPG